MKNDQIRIRISTSEKEQIVRDVAAAKFDSISAYLLHLARRYRPRLKK